MSVTKAYHRVRRNWCKLTWTSEVSFYWETFCSLGSLLSFKDLSCSLVNRHLNLALEVGEILQYPCQTLITRISGYLVIIFLTVALLKPVQSFKFLPKLHWHLQIYWQHFKSNLFKRICEFEKKKSMVSTNSWIRVFGYVLYIAFGRYLAVTQKKK